MTYHEWITSDGWKQKRAEALTRASYKCQVCSRRDTLEVHHNTYERMGHEIPSDLCVLCREHHRLFEENGGIVPHATLELLTTYGEIIALLKRCCELSAAVLAMEHASVRRGDERPSDMTPADKLTACVGIMLIDESQRARRHEIIGLSAAHRKAFGRIARGLNAQVAELKEILVDWVQVMEDLFRFERDNLDPEPISIPPEDEIAELAAQLTPVSEVVH